MRDILISVKNEYATRSNKIAGAAGSGNAVRLMIAFDEQWDGLAKNAFFVDSRGEKEITKSLAIDPETGLYPCIIPFEPLAYEGEMALTLKGFQLDSGGSMGVCIVSARTYFDVLPADDVTITDTESAVTPSLAEQLEAQIAAQAELFVEKAQAAAAAAKQSGEHAAAAKESEEAAQGYAQNAEDAAQRAEAAKTAAAKSATSASIREASATASANAARAAQGKAEAAQAAAEAAQTGAETAQAAAKASEGKATASEGAAKISETAAAASEAAAKASEGAAKASETAAAASETAAEASETAAKASETAAKEAQTKAEAALLDTEAAKATAVAAKTNAENSAMAAAQSETAAAGSAATASTKAAAAQTAQSKAEAAQAAAETAQAGAVTAKNAAETAKTEAGTSAANAAESAKKAESWAVGGTGTRPGEDVNNAKYWSDVAQATAGGGVTSFNGRGGAVVPTAGDYTAEMVGADPAGTAEEKAGAVTTALTNHAGNTTVHITAEERTKWNGKQNALTFDDTPTANSNNPVTSGGVKSAIVAVETVANNTSGALTTHTGNTTVHITAAERTTWNGKQNALTFDDVPTASSNNPVKSSGVKSAIDTAVAAHADKTDNPHSVTLGQLGVKALTVSLTVAGWTSSLTQTVTATGVTAAGNVIVSPAPASLDAYSSAGVRCTAQAANVLTFQCKKKPTEALMVEVLCL